MNVVRWNDAEKRRSPRPASEVRPNAAETPNSTPLSVRNDRRTREVFDQFAAILVLSFIVSLPPKKQST